VDEPILSEKDRAATTLAEMGALLPRYEEAGG
jgi:hypothetical protein